MVKGSTLAALNKQIQHEQTNAHAYDSVSLFFGHLGLHGFEAFMAEQAREERVHAEKLIRHVADRGGRVELGAIAAPKVNFESALDAVKFVRDMERATTESIHRLFEMARKEGDYALEVLLHWFVTEQVEEEQWAEELAALVEQFHDRPGQLYMLDHQWGKRVKENHE
jgi:ferritin